jgi:hypothetical protein
MTEQSKPSEYDQLTHLVECYLGLESMEATFALLELCGVTLDVRALPRLKRRLQEEEAQIPLLQQRGYIRMREKCEQLVTSLRPLIVTLEHMAQDAKEESV